MAPPPRLIALALLGCLVAGCTSPVPPPTPTPTTAGPSAPVLAVPTDAAEALSSLAEPHTTSPVDLSAAERVWLRRGETTIDEAGTYLLRGWVAGNLVVEAGDDPVVLVLDGLTLRSADAAAIEARSAGRLVVVAAEGSANVLVVEADHPAIAARGALTVQGTGVLEIDSAGDGLTAGAGVVLAQGSVRVNAAGTGVRAGGYLVVEDTTLAVAADGDGLLAEGDPARGSGFVLGRDPFLTVSAGGDGIRASGDLIVQSGALEVRTAGGHESTLDGDADATALRAGRHLVVDDGRFELDAAGDGGNAGVAVVVNGGDWRIAAGDDAVHGDRALVVNGGEIAVTAATEGLEAETVRLTGGTIDVVAADDALNASEADDPLAVPSITIGGGTIRLDSAGGDGLDANGNVAMTGGQLTVLGAPVDNESALDYDGEFLISGGSLVAGGGAGMA